jgi:hypothetical protein
VLVMHGTKKFLERVGRPSVPADTPSTTQLGSWYATVLFWRPQVALFVNVATLTPLLLPFAPATSVLARFGVGLDQLLEHQGVSRPFIDAELSQLGQVQLAKTCDRSLLGSMNEFAYLADVDRHSIAVVDLVGLSLRLAETPCGPLYRRHVTPHDELLARVASTWADQATYF